MKKMILTLILKAAKIVGLFAISRRLTARDLRIICYHGASLRGEHDFSPGLFISKDTFAERMDYLARKCYPIISLDEALGSLKQGTWPRCATVITIDDGWYGTYSVMGPILRNHGFPATLYIASYYLKNQVQVFNVATNYVLWRAGGQRLDLSRVSSNLSGYFDLGDATQRAEAHRPLNEFATTLDGAEARQGLFRELCKAVGLDWRMIEEDRICCFMNAEEARELHRGGIDIQLHTHRHRYGTQSFEQAKIEIEDNRRVLETISNSQLRHFCYPGGFYDKQTMHWLERFDIVSATTTKSGFNRRNESPYELRRFLDGERVSPIEFEAEMSGFFELIRRCGYSI